MSFWNPSNMATLGETPKLEKSFVYDQLQNMLFWRWDQLTRDLEICRMAQLWFSLYYKHFIQVYFQGLQIVWNETLTLCKRIEDIHTRCFQHMYEALRHPLQDDPEFRFFFTRLRHLPVVHQMDASEREFFFGSSLAPAPQTYQFLSDALQATQIPTLRACLRFTLEWIQDKQADAISTLVARRLVHLKAPEKSARQERAVKMKMVMDVAQRRVATVLRTKEEQEEEEEEEPEVITEDQLEEEYQTQVQNAMDEVFEETHEDAEEENEDYDIIWQEERINYWDAWAVMQKKSDQPLQVMQALEAEKRKHAVLDPLVWTQRIKDLLDQGGEIDLVQEQERMRKEEMERLIQEQQEDDAAPDPIHPEAKQQREARFLDRTSKMGQLQHVDLMNRLLKKSLSQMDHGVEHLPDDLKRRFPNTLAAATNKVDETKLKDIKRFFKITWMEQIEHTTELGKIKAARDAASIVMGTKQELRMKDLLRARNTKQREKEKKEQVEAVLHDEDFEGEAADGLRRRKRKKPDPGEAKLSLEEIKALRSRQMFKNTIRAHTGHVDSTDLKFKQMARLYKTETQQLYKNRKGRKPSVILREMQRHYEATHRHMGKQRDEEEAEEGQAHPNGWDLLNPGVRRAPRVPRVPHRSRRRQVEEEEEQEDEEPEEEADNSSDEEDSEDEEDEEDDP